MKKLISIFFAVFTIFSASYSQTQEESALMKKVNEYRKSKGLKTLQWDNTVYKIAEYQARYLCILDSPPYNKMIVTHNEDIDVEGFDEFATLSDRAYEFSNDKYFFCGENAAILNLTKLPTLDSIVNKTMESWKKSKGHNGNLKNNKYTVMGCSIKYFSMELTHVSTLTGKTIKIKIESAIVVLTFH